MSESLSQLNQLEEKLLKRVRSVSGLMEEKDKQLEDDGIYTEYAKVFALYVELLQSESDGDEALRRAVFLMWYAQAEPSCFTGLSNLPEESTRALYETLESKAAEDDIDVELLRMVAFYDEIAEWVFAEEKGLPTFRRMMERTANDSWMSELDPKDFAHRGQMGEYWSSICDSHASRHQIAEMKGNLQT